MFFSTLPCRSISIPNMWNRYTIEKNKAKIVFCLIYFIYVSHVRSGLQMGYTSKVHGKQHTERCAECFSLLWDRIRRTCRKKHEKYATTIKYEMIKKKQRQRPKLHLLWYVMFNMSCICCTTRCATTSMTNAPKLDVIKTRQIHKKLYGTSPYEIKGLYHNISTCPDMQLVVQQSTTNRSSGVWA